jgi:phage terminase large subunit-like protein
MIENRWVTAESDFVDMDWWDQCVDPDLSRALADPSLPVWVGVDASVKRDSTAVVAATFDRAARKVRLVWHRIFQPSPSDPLDFEATIEKTLVDMRRRFNVREVRYDPYQLVAVAQRLTAAGLPMVEFPQSVPNLTEASTNLYDVIKSRNLIVYPDVEVRLAVSRCVALETTRGWRIAKEKASHKIDVVVALAQAALAAVQGAGATPVYEFASTPRSRSGAWEGTGIADRDNPYAHGEAVAEAEDLAAAIGRGGRWGRWGGAW